MLSLFFTLLSVNGFAEDSSKPKVEDKKEDPKTNKTNNTVFDQTHQFMSEKILSITDSLDNIIGDEEIILEGRKSAGIIALNSTITDGAGMTTRAKISLRVKLQKTENRLNLIVDNISDKTRNDEVEPTELEKVKSDSEDNGLSAALKYLLTEDERWEVNTKAGIKIRIPTIDPFVTFRAHRKIPIFKWKLGISQNVFWFNSVGFGEVTRADIDFPLPNSFLVRFANSASWLKNEDFFRFNHSFTLVHPIGDKRSLSYSAGASGLSDPNVHVSSYSIAASYRQQFLRKWIHLDIIPGLSYPRANNFVPVASIAIRLESYFGEVK